MGKDTLLGEMDLRARPLRDGFMQPLRGALALALLLAAMGFTAPLGVCRILYPDLSP